MKKLFAAVCILALSMMTLAGCGSSNKETAAATEAVNEAATEAAESLESAAEQAEGKVLSVGIIQMIENGAFNDMREGFIAELRDKGYTEDKLTVDYKCAQGDATNLQTIAQSMADGDYDLICTIATPATQAMVNLEVETPVVFIAVSAPVAAGVITDMDHPDKNATGTSNAIPVSDIFALSDTLTPGCETYGFLYCTSEVNSVNTVESAKAYCDENGIAYKEATVTNSSEVQQAAQSLIGSVDAIFIPNDSVVQASMTLVTEVARDAKIPVYGSSATMVDSGAFATVAISDTGIGAMSADMAIQILEGAAVADVPAIVVPASSTVINSQTLEALGITLPEDIQNSAVFVEDAQ
ncbi:MAG: ABC transporter substrate binding protein [Coprococcus sp.]